MKEPRDEMEGKVDTILSALVANKLISREAKKIQLCKETPIDRPKLKEKIYKDIKRYKQKDRYLRFKGKFVSISQKIAIIFVTLILISFAMILSVEAIRVPFFNLFFE